MLGVLIANSKTKYILRATTEAQIIEMARDKAGVSGTFTFDRTDLKS